MFKKLNQIELDNLQRSHNANYEALTRVMADVSQLKVDVYQMQLKQNALLKHLGLEIQDNYSTGERYSVKKYSK